MRCDATTKATWGVRAGTNMADSNRRQDKSHVGENQEFTVFLVGENFAFQLPVWHIKLSLCSISFIFRQFLNFLVYEIIF